MKFVDEVRIEVKAGHGGPGAVSYRREKFVPRGGPDGGDGGKGGDVVFRVDEGLNTLLHYRGKKSHKAEDGLPGRGQLANGRNGEDTVLRVPPGTVITAEKLDENEEVVSTQTFDLSGETREVVVAAGGQGGKGNAFFKSSTHQTPRFAQDGLEGESFRLFLELKLLADVGLLGLPNAGKSTLISSISNARPKVADYPFTTLVPQLGVVALGEKTLVMADVPGLIEDAAQGKGLGHQFLRHLERTKVLVHLIDCSMLLEPFEAVENYATIRKEIESFDSELGSKREIVCLTKIDAMKDEEIKAFQEEVERVLDKRVLTISAVAQKNLQELKTLLFQALIP